MDAHLDAVSFLDRDLLYFSDRAHFKTKSNITMDLTFLRR